MNIEKFKRLQFYGKTQIFLQHWKNSIAKRTIFWSSEPENIAIRPMLRYGPQNYTSIGEAAIQVRWYDNTMYSDRKQNIMPSLSLLWIFACDKTICDTQKWSFKERKNAPNKSTNASKKRLEKMTLLSHFKVSRVHAKQCIGRAANQYSCLTYTAWVDTLYTDIGRTAILFFPCMAEYPFFSVYVWRIITQLCFTDLATTI